MLARTKCTGECCLKARPGRQGSERSNHSRNDVPWLLRILTKRIICVPAHPVWECTYITADCQHILIVNMTGRSQIAETHPSAEQAPTAAAAGSLLTVYRHLQENSLQALISTDMPNSGPIFGFLLASCGTVWCLCWRFGGGDWSPADLEARISTTPAASVWCESSWTDTENLIGALGRHNSNQYCRFRFAVGLFGAFDGYQFMSM